VVGTPVQERAAFQDALKYLRNRIAAFVALPLASIDRLSLGAKLQEIGGQGGASRRRPDVA
jgi:arsenate reductase